MAMLITLIVYLIAGAILWYILLLILSSVGATEPVVKIAKLIFLLIAFLVIVGLFFGGYGVYEPIQLRR